ncbi:HlyD family secretion protein [Bradyrhizobium sp. ISRA443]|uniref:HlyD family secretion protein n=1 Tax=unclassified Bradyrhizobium TaxID=2631580 RepID=UPI00247B122D|nr:MULTISPECIES: HlyD family secretion protein [unclassified Bradyrhizobium]WGR92733.1 HlyD family secretion protein [Bradyrhizobium sp. ISRA435]WGR97190.1 HlyD family secretion protein [Bradyrhizobium sp. ISRA436]WGS04078.1 HlyD family secretion protein [Bradyrhizobium sp. ISRA437]WGS10961.1 HlyD family secretion protein [Bradyrhizobium sp. ISRA443]
MSQHETSFKAESQVPAETAKQLIANPEAAKPPAQKGKLRRLLLAGVAATVLAGAAWYGWNYWTVGRFLVSTDDAYVKADNTTIAPKVSGYLSNVLVGDNEHVHAGQVLARIDDRDFKVALDQAKADVAAAEAAVTSKRAQLDVQQSVIEAARATLAVDTAAQTFAAQENKRYTDLAGTGFGSVQNAQQAQSRYASAQAAIARDTANLASALRQVELLKAEIAQAVAAQERASALQHQAELNLGYTTITAPIDGVVGNRTLRTGQFVQAGTQLMSLVPATGAYVIANFKETQLTDVRKGQPVEIAVDMFPGQVVHGHVDSLAPASGQEFALLPPDNATGNFTKVVQRIPVKIALDATAVELRPGMSVIPTIATLSRPAPASHANSTPKVAVASFK